MAVPGEREHKVFAGPRIRQLRRARGLTQARMAEELRISPSYLNLIERNQRPLTAQVLLRLAEVYDTDLRTLAPEDDAGTLGALREAFADPLFSGLDLPDHELRDLAHTAPGAAQGLALLYRAYLDSRTSASGLAELISGREATPGSEATRLPVEEVRDFFHDRLNHFPVLDEAAETLYEQGRFATDDPYVRLREHLDSAHGVAVRVVPVDVMSTALRRYDYHRRCVFLSELLDQTGRIFQLAYQIALFEQRASIDRIVAEGEFSSEESRRVCRVGLASYFAGALVMPYERFLRTAETVRHDIEVLGRRFGASFEQVCHRLTTLQRPGGRGIPFFLLRVDSAGNVTKRFGAGRFPFARSGGACPLWNVHDTFRLPGHIFAQHVRLPDGSGYFSIARAVSRPGARAGAEDQLLSVGLGCEVAHAHRLVYADGFHLDDAATGTPIGINCLLCERPDCTHRAFPPLKRRLAIDESVRGLSPFPFEGD
jgi:hypothetical protein